jgi:hypothetical protein
MHLRNYRVTRQIESSSPQSAQRFVPEAFGGGQCGQDERVMVCYEAGCFGYEPVRRIQAIGRSLLLQRGMAVRGRWWRASTRERIASMASW